MDKLVINLDCVGNGDNMIVITKEDAERTVEYELLRKTLSTEDNTYSVHYVPFKKSSGLSDHRSFPRSICVMAANKGNFVKRGLQSRFICVRIYAYGLCPNTL